MKNNILFLFLCAFLFVISSAADCADRYWVGGSGTWDNTNTSNWSTSSGGGGGASFPTGNDNVYFDGGSASDNYAVTISGIVSCENLSIDKPTGSGKKITISGSSMNLDIYGDLNYAGGAAGVVDNITWYVIMVGASHHNITSNGVVHSCILDIVIGSWTILADPWVTSGEISNYGTIDLGSATHEFNGPGLALGWVFMNSGGTVIAGTSTLKITNTANGNSDFIGGDQTYNNLWYSRGASTGNLIIEGSNTFNNFKDDGTAAHSLVFAAGSTQHITNFSVSGAAGNLKTITSSSTGDHYLVKDGGGVINCNYLNIQHSVATPDNKWYAGNNSVDNQDVPTAGSGWIFSSSPPTESEGMLVYDTTLKKLSVFTGSTWESISSGAP